MKIVKKILIRIIMIISEDRVERLCWLCGEAIFFSCLSFSLFYILLPNMERKWNELMCGHSTVRE